jgi:foldase protein PrsA
MDIKRRYRKRLKKPALAVPKVPIPAVKLPVSKAEPEKPIGTGPVPQITNESIAEHREAVLGSASKYIYPLRLSSNRVVKFYIALFLAAIVLFFVGSVVALYKMQNTSTFMYSVTRIVPFPVAKAGDNYVSYNSYLFELRHYVHYYQSQQGVNFKSDDGKRQLANFKQQSLDQAVSQAYVKRLATKHHLSVSSKEVNDQVALVRAQNRLGSSDEVFRNVLSEFWGWSVADFKRELKNELLEQKVIATLDTSTNKRANDVLTQLQGGADFATLAAQASDDAATKGNGGEYGFAIDRSSRDISPQAVQQLYKLQAGQYSGVINSGYYLEIDKVLEVNGDKLRAAHITFNYDDISTYLKPVEQQHPTRYYLHL